MIAVALLVLAAWCGPAAQEGRRGTDLAPDAQQDPERLAALRLDPRSLPRAPLGRWKDFDPGAKPDEELRPLWNAVAGALRGRDLPAALIALHRLLRAEPDHPPALHELGVVYFRLQRYGDAIAPFERYVEHLPERIADTRALGHAYYSLGRYAEARAHYERVLAKAPDMVEAVRGHALALLRLGDEPGALAGLERVLVLDPAHDEAWTWKAQILYDREELEPALAAARKARDLAPDEPRPWFLIGRIEGELGHADESRAAQRRYEELHAASEAVRALESALALHPHDVAMLERLVDACRATGSLAKTRGALQRLVAERPREFGPRWKALDALETLGDRAGALEAATVLEELFPDRAEVWERLAEFYGRRGDRPNQLRAGERLLRLRGR